MVLIHESAEQISSFKVESQGFVEGCHMNVRRHDWVVESEKALRIFVGDAGQGALSLIKVSTFGCQWRKTVSKRAMESMCRISKHHNNTTRRLLVSRSMKAQSDTVVTILIVLYCVVRPVPYI